MYRRQETLPAESRALLARHVTSLESNIYAVRNLPPEVVAVLFAYVSRSPLTFRENLWALLQSGDLEGVEPAGQIAPGQDDVAHAAAAERAKKFHEKWVVGYGHASVAEHADLKYAVDDISILAAKFLENNRLGAYTEKSSRYQVFATDSFITPPELLEPGREELGAKFEATCRRLFEVYNASFEPLQRLMAERFPRGEKTSERAYEASLKAKACDVARYLLPAATLTSVGISWNARVAEHAINKCLSSGHAEFREIGRTLLEEGRKICPTLLKHAGEKAYFRDTAPALAALLKSLPQMPPEQRGNSASMSIADSLGAQPYVASTRWSGPNDVEHRLVTAILYPFTHETYPDLLARTARFSDEQGDQVLSEFFARRGKFDWPLRELEHEALQFEMEMDYGAWRDVQRHRMATITEKPTTCRLGFDTPEEMSAAGLERDYREAMDAARETYETLSELLPAAAPYVVAQGFRKRVLISWNLRELEHFIRLRSGKQGHIAYRRVAQLAHEALAKNCPRLARYFACDHDDYGLGRLEAEERSEAKRRAAAP